MSANLTAVVVATVGVVGTLIAPILAQRGGLTARRAEAEIQRVERAEQREEKAEERSDAADYEAVERRRQVYAELNARARNYRSAALDYLSALRRGANGQGSIGETRGELDAARKAFAQCHSEAQMIVPDEILEMSTKVSRELGSSYRLLIQAASEDDFQAANDYIQDTTGEALWLMRAAMRKDLGVTGEEPGQNLDLGSTPPEQNSAGGDGNTS